MESVDETRPMEPELDDTSRMVDESHVFPELDSSEVAPPISRIKVISPQHPTIISSAVDSHHILPYSRRPTVFLSTHDKSPRTFKQALNSSKREVWSSAIQKELSSMNRLQAWEVVDLKPDYKLVGTTWVFRTKRNHLNEIIEYKARLCAQGFTKTPGLDFEKTYAPAGRMNSLQTLISFAASNNLHFHQVDIKNELEKFRNLSVSYHSAIGSINYLSTVTRPDLSYAVSSLSQFLETPGINHWNNFLHVLKYLNGTQNIGLFYSWGSKEGIRAYSNADWGNCQETRWSVTGFLVTFKGNLVIWKTRKQPSVLISTAEAKYKALCDQTSEMIWFWQWCNECSLYITSEPIPVHEDNQSCISTVEGDSNLNQRRMKHINIRLHFVKEFVKNSSIQLIYTPTNLMLADFLTKSVNHLSLSIIGLTRPFASRSEGGC
ncbi:hypothetical protein O181_013788 [Austropuccinia psidii MF-1]|uniref:Reverse transcriptase Ty1/copia-type domain-containing protein n=1 Tax=Austropuccinia psidii MF-1 TaxID=1389203 RepID=A0A9Q3BZZ7_9BASI|nr:hypothetical protein [Austropuccinia psidii MF-1]